MVGEGNDQRRLDPESCVGVQKLAALSACLAVPGTAPVTRKDWERSKRDN